MCIVVAIISRNCTLIAILRLMIHRLGICNGQW